MPEQGRIGYVLKVFPRLSETFILSEVLAHERAGRELEIFSLRRPDAGPVHEAVDRLRAQVTYVEHAAITVGAYERAIERAGAELPAFAARIAESSSRELLTAYQAVEIALAARRRGLDHLHAHFASAAAGVARLAARFAGISYSLTAHAKDIFHESVDLSELRGRLTDASAAVTVSDYNAEFLSSVAPGARIERVNNGLELEHFPFSDPGGRPPLIAAVGRLVEKKGFEDLVTACSVLARRGRHFECRIAGGGELEAALHEQIARLRLEPRVRLLGPCTQPEVTELVGGAAALAAPCVVGADGNRDGLPTVLLEAMALGTPCVATPVTGIPELVRHGETGLLVPEHDPRALADTLEALLASDELRRRLACPARALVAHEYDIERNAAALRALLDASGDTPDDDPTPKERLDGHPHRIPVG